MLIFFLFYFASFDFLHRLIFDRRGFYSSIIVMIIIFSIYLLILNTLLLVFFVNYQLIVSYQVGIVYYNCNNDLNKNLNSNVIHLFFSFGEISEIPLCFYVYWKNKIKVSVASLNIVVVFNRFMTRYLHCFVFIISKFIYDSGDEC